MYIRVLALRTRPAQHGALDGCWKSSPQHSENLAVEEQTFQGLDEDARDGLRAPILVQTVFRNMWEMAGMSNSEGTDLLTFDRRQTLSPRPRLAGSAQTILLTRGIKREMF